MKFLFSGPKSNKLFVTLLLLVVFGSSIVYGLFILASFKEEGETFRRNITISEYQFKKIDRFRNIDREPIETIILGDSSAGNALNARIFSNLIGHRVESLALTASFGLAGTYNMLRHVTRDNPIKNVIIVHSLDFWNREFSRQGYLDTLRGLPLDGELVGLLGNTSLGSVQPQRNETFQKLFLTFVATSTIDADIDYLPQVGELTITQNTKVRADIQPGKVTMYKLLDRYCGEQRLNCIFISGPLTEAVALRSEEEIDDIFSAFQEFSNIRFFNHVLLLSLEETGDSIDHVAYESKDAVTRRYFQILTPYLIP